MDLKEFLKIASDAIDTDCNESLVKSLPDIEKDLGNNPFLPEILFCIYIYLNNKSDTELVDFFDKYKVDEITLPFMAFEINHSNVKVNQKIIEKILLKYDYITSLQYYAEINNNQILETNDPDCLLHIIDHPEIFPIYKEEVSFFDNILESINNYYIDRVKSLNLKSVIFYLYNSISLLKDICQEQIFDIEIAHYTSINKFKFLVQADNPKLRLYNSIYMNDPAEGKVLHNILKDVDFDFTANQNKNFSNTYISSFTANIDFLPMWSLYGDLGNGCCLVLDNNYFSKIDDMNLGLHQKYSDCLYNKELHEKLKFTSDNYAKECSLYKVIYYDEKGNKFLHENSNEIDTCISRITYAIDAILKEKNEISDDDLIRKIDNYILDMIDSIRYLFKNQDYAYEKEYRAIKYTTNPAVDITPDLPKLYFEIEKPLPYVRVILGPKFVERTKIDPYLHFIDKYKKVEDSKIKFQ